jgi:hypothetical protein
MNLKFYDYIENPKILHCYNHGVDCFWIDPHIWICPFGGEFLELHLLWGVPLHKILPDFQSWQIVR